MQPTAKWATSSAGIEGAGAADEGKFTLTLRRETDGRWLIVSDMDDSNSRGSEREVAVDALDSRSFGHASSSRGGRAATLSAGVAGSLHKSAVTSLW